jgi:uncharacterized protein YdbL (DUF1318 family)
MNRITARLILFILPILLICSSNLFAQGIKDRFKERLPVIVELKTAGIVGENNLGYLEFRGAVKKNEDVVNAENEDRKKIYEAIAKKENTTAELVGKLRAKKIAEKAEPGDWLQDEKGKWYKE